MEKTIRKFIVHNSLDWNYNGEISKIKNDIEELEKLGATHIEIDIEEEYSEQYIKIKAVSNRLETDEEYNQRMNEENERKEYAKRKDLETLERIKQKYGI